jgi:hypothetical protein
MSAISNSTEQRLWFWVERFSKHFTADDYRELGEVESSLQDPSVFSNRRRALIFSVYQLLINGAISEHQIQLYESEFPEFVSARLGDECLNWATVEAWEGSAYAPARPNILGSIAFMVVLLFFFESACRMELNDYNSHLAPMLEKLKKQRRIGSEECEALKYLAEFRNTWHNFGLYSRKTECRYEVPGASLSFPTLNPDQVIGPLYEPEAIHLLDKLLSTFCRLTDVQA